MYADPLSVRMLKSTMTFSSSVVVPSKRQLPVSLSQRYLRSPCTKEFVSPPMQLNMKYRACCQFSLPPIASHSFEATSDRSTWPWAIAIPVANVINRFSLILMRLCIISENHKNPNDHNTIEYE